MTQFAQITPEKFINVDKIDSFSIKIKNMEDGNSCYYDIIAHYNHQDFMLFTPPFYEEDEAIDYLKKYLDNGLRLLD